jgi:hypothetical protein|tara:strand:+ start:428 stop:652 length:225 start_codon:yes stop_codon:yes gene_type:complete
MSGVAVATLSLLGVLAFVLLIVWNWYFFHRLDVGFLEWLRGATSMQRLAALLDGFFVFFGALHFLEVLMIFAII